MSGVKLVLGAAVGAFLAAGLLPLATSPVAHAVPVPCVTDDSAPVCDTDFISSTINFFDLFSNTVAADPNDNGFVATVFSSQLLGIRDILTSGADPSNSLGSIPGLSDIGTAGVGVSGETVNTLITPFFESTFAIPITDPFASLFTDLVSVLVALGF